MEKQLSVSSPAFSHEGILPEKYSCDGEGINPPIVIDNIPEEAKKLALIVEDPDAPSGVYDHWIVWNIPVRKSIAENSNPGTSGNNSSGKTGYHPACPPSGEHRYFFHVFALDTEIDLLAGESREKLEELMEGHVLARGTVMGRYGRKK